MKHFLRQNGLLLLIIALLLSVLIGIVSAVMGGNADPLSNAVGFITTPIRNGVSAVLDWADGVRAYVFHYEEMEQQIQDLERQVAELEEQAREGQEASRENEQLRELLDLQAKRRDFVFESAKVTARSSTNWDSTLTIGKGSSAGLEVNDCVITETGTLVGVVSEVGLNWSKVSTLINTDIEIGGQVTRTYSAGILEGDFTLMSQGKLKLSYLPGRCPAGSRGRGGDLRQGGRVPLRPGGGHRGGRLHRPLRHEPLRGGGARCGPGQPGGSLCHQEL